LCTLILKVESWNIYILFMGEVRFIAGRFNVSPGAGWPLCQCGYYREALFWECEAFSKNAWHFKDILRVFVVFFFKFLFFLKTFSKKLRLFLMNAGLFKYIYNGIEAFLMQCVALFYHSSNVRNFEQFWAFPVMWGILNNFEPF
jgi:hypothetical protein